jgi:hypothetical protein
MRATGVLRIWELKTPRPGRDGGGLGFVPMGGGGVYCLLIGVFEEDDSVLAAR